MMRPNINSFCLIPLLAALFLLSCNSKIQEKKDNLYSRHLQRRVDLEVFNTPLPDDKSDLNLLIILHGSDQHDWNISAILDSLHASKSIEPLLVVVAHARQPDELGISDWNVPDLPGKKADHFNQFVVNELLPFIRKRATVRKFHSVALLGAGKAGIAAFDLAWQHDEKFPRLGIFSGAWQDWKRNPSDSSAILQYLAQTRKRPKLEYWLYAGGKPDSTEKYHTQLLASRLAQKSFVRMSDIQLHIDPDRKNDAASWNQELPAFLVWAFGK